MGNRDIGNKQPKRVDIRCSDNNQYCQNQSINLTNTYDDVRHPKKNKLFKWPQKQGT